MTTPAASTDRPTLTLTETLTLAGIAAVCLAAWVALGLAHAEAYSLATWALLTGAGAAGLAVLAWRYRPRVALAGKQVAAAGAVAVVTLALTLPGFPFGMAGWDPGVYVNHAFAIDRTGGHDLVDEPVALGLPMGGFGGSGRMPGLVVRDAEAGRSQVGFYHLYPALLAPAVGVAGERGAVNVNPFLAVLANVGLLLLAWRAFGPLAGVLAGGLSAIFVLQVWHARYPTTEILTQLLVTGALLALVIAVTTRWRPAAVIAGVLTGLTFYSRADGVLILMLGVAAVAGAMLVGRFRGPWPWFAAGLAVTVPHGLAQAFRFADVYSRVQSVPGPLTLGAVSAVLLGGAAAGHLATQALEARARPRTSLAAARARLGDIDWPRLLGIVAVAGFGLLLAVNYARPVFLPADAPRLDKPFTYFNARSLLRVTWFLSPAGILAAWAGLAAVALRRWTLPAWIAVVPALVTLPVYLWEPRIHPRLLWWTRRFVPYVLPGLLLLIAAGLAAALLWRGRHRWLVVPAGAVATAVIVVTSLSMTLPLRSHSELAGSFRITHDAQHLAGEAPAVFLWSPIAGEPGVTDVATGFASTVWFRYGQVSALLDGEADESTLRAYAEAYPDRPVFVVTNGHGALGDLPRNALEEVAAFEHRFPLWELTYDHLPRRAVELRYQFIVWRYIP